MKTSKSGKEILVAIKNSLGISKETIAKYSLYYNCFYYSDSEIKKEVEAFQKLHAASKNIRFFYDTRGNLYAYSIEGIFTFLYIRARISVHSDCGKMHEYWNWVPICVKNRKLVPFTYKIFVSLPFG